tara:strand:- start:204 stop:1424 length:1221 start_codon:yes stop_codon:yes gene_type:complete
MFTRSIAKRIETALSDTRVVLITGPRQAGKTTLAQSIAGSDTPFFTLDNASTLDAARQDPVGFIRGLDKAVIDEVQRAPDLLLAIKESVDNDQRPGRFLLTGSANLMTLPRVADSLAGRMEVAKLLPLSQSEMQNIPSTFLDSIFAGKIPTITAPLIANDLVQTVLAGGYPEAVARASHKRRQDWYLNYIDAIVQRDINEIAKIEQAQQVPRLLQALAHHSGQLINYSKVGSLLDMNSVTTQKYTGILEQLFLVSALPPWHTNRIKRLVKSPKLHFLDSGLLAALQDITLEKINKDRRVFGSLLETFVFTELQKLASWNNNRYEFAHFRDKQQNEVDIVLRNRSGQIVGIEIKASAAVNSSDFSGLRKLADAYPKEFVLGLVLYDHDQTIPFGEKLMAAPISALWH